MTRIAAACLLSVALLFPSGTISRAEQQGASPLIDQIEQKRGAAEQQDFTPVPDRAISAQCCKTCRKGKPCGNSCISRDKTCHKGPGCAC